MGSAAFARELNNLGLFAVTLVLASALLLQLTLGELPCPLCLLQRVGFIAVGFGLLLNIRFGPAPLHYGLVILGALIFAAVKSDAKSVASLAAAGAEVDYAVPAGTNALLIALTSRAWPVVDALIAKGASVTSKDRTGNTPLHLASQFGGLETVKQLIAKGADVNLKSGKSQGGAGRGGGGGGGRGAAVTGEQTPLLLAARGNHLDVMRALVAGGADPKLKAQDGTTLLMAAAASGHVEAVQYAFELSPEVKAVTETKQAVMHSAVSAGIQTTTVAEICKVVQFLAEKGADVEPADTAGRTPLTIARALPGTTVVELLTRLKK